MGQTGANRIEPNPTGPQVGPMTWTSAFGRGCGVLLDAIVRWLALARINPNVLTFLGLVVNTIAAFLFGYANGDNQARMFRYAGLVIIGSGFFDLVDGRVARASNQVTRFGGFFDSVIDRYSDASQFFGLLVFYSRGDRFFYVVLTAFVDGQRHHGELHTRPRRIAHRLLPRRIYGAARTPGAGDHRGPVQSHGAGLVADRGAFHNHSNPPHSLHLDANRRRRRTPR